MMKCGVKRILGSQSCKYGKRHEWNCLTDEFIDWVVFGIVWASLSVELSSQPKYCTTKTGGRFYSDPCNTLYAAYGMSIALWVLFSVSWIYVALTILRQVVETKREQV
jgi:hypothetical protein